MKYINKENILGLLGNRFFLIVIIIVLILFALKQCENAELARDEASREHNNYLASVDSVRIIKNKLGELIVEKSAYQLKVSELSKDQKDLIKRLDLNTNGRGTTPRTVIQTVSEYKETIINIKSEVVKNPDGSEMIKFNHEPNLPGKNRLKITGEVPYNITLLRNPSDSTRYLASVNSMDVTLEIEQNIDIVTGLYRDPKSGRIMTRVSTTYPNLTFNEVNSFDITDDPETRKALKNARKEFGLGVSVGYGLIGNSNSMNTGIFIGLGLNYSPKFLQFGK
jgi:hypothetical protein